MIHHLWRLTESSESNLGLTITADGVLLGRTPLVERRDEQFVVRDRREVERLLRRAYPIEFHIDRVMHGLANVAAALNANDRCLAHIAAVHLRIPDLANQSARADLKAEDVLIKSMHSNSDPHQRKVQKASPDDPEHPGWPAGTEGGLGGKFRPKTEAEITVETKDRIRRIAMRRALRIGALAILRLGGETAANAIPFLGFVADVATVADLAYAISEFKKLANDATAAIAFVEKGPQNLEDLQVSSSGYEEFSSYDEFLKDSFGIELMAKRFGPAGDGSQYHHIVTQGGENADNIPPEQLQNTDTIIRLPTLLHEAVNAEYLKPKRGTGMNIYQWLQTQPYEVQREEGLRILRDLGILK